MTTLGQRDQKTRRRVVKLFREALGDDHLGDWAEREGSRTIESRISSQRGIG